VIGSLQQLLTSKKEEVNAACPGETSLSFMMSGVTDYGCNSMGPQGQPPYKTWAGLHTTYSGTQLSFALSQLSTNKQINLVTLGIGSNDVLLFIRNCGLTSDPPGCINNGLPGVFSMYAYNLGQILTLIRSTSPGAGYQGTLVLVGYYSPSPDLNTIAVTLNSIMKSMSAQFHTIFADGFTAFETAAAPFGGEVCKAGLLIRLSPTTCDIHPTPIGQDLLAATVLASIFAQH
jgi:lysophospholipase L1-like esterase